MITLAWYTLLLFVFCMVDSIVHPFDPLLAVALTSPGIAFSGIFIYRYYKENKKCGS